MTEPGRTGRRLDIALRLRRPGPWLQRLLTAVAAVVFLAMVLWGLEGFRAAGTEVRWPLLLAALGIGTPLAVALNGAELRVMAGIVDAELGRSEALTASLYASAANALPLPGSVLVRGWSLRQAGVPLARVAAVQTLAGGTFVAVAALATGPAIALAAPTVGWPLTVAGAAALAVLARGRARAVARLGLVELAMVASEMARLSAVAVALGLDPSLPRAGGLVMAGVAAVAVGVFPAGLGAREALAAMTARATALPAAVSVTVSVTDRVGTSLVLAAMLGLALVATGAPRRLDVGAEPT